MGRAFGADDSYIRECVGSTCAGCTQLVRSAVIFSFRARLGWFVEKTLEFERMRTRRKHSLFLLDESSESKHA